MARSGFSTSNFLRCGSGLITAAPLSLAAWVNPTALGSQQAIVGLYSSAAGNGGDQFSIILNAVGRPAALTGDGGGSASIAATGTGIGTGTYGHCCAVFASATSRVAYLNGAGKNTDTTSKVPSAIDRISIGAQDNAAIGGARVPLTGAIAEVGLWNTALSDADVAALAAGISPLLVQPEALVHYWPLWGEYSPEIDLLSNASTQTVQGSLSVAPHAPILTAG